MSIATDWREAVLALDPCSEATAWLKSRPDAETAWQTCPRGDWMLWLLGCWSGPPESESRRRLVLAACACARLSLPYVTAGENRPLAAIETAERWARRENGVTRQHVRDATDAATAAYTAAAWPAAASAAESADVAAYAADAAVCAADAAVCAADTAAYTAAAASAAASAAESYAHTRTLQRCADIVREHYPDPPEIGGEV